MIVLNKTLQLILTFRRFVNVSFKYNDIIPIKNVNCIPLNTFV